MPDSKITALTALTAADPANDMIPIVDVSDTPPASGNTKRISINNLLACSPSATLASATITGDLTVDTSTLKVDSANDAVGIGTTSPTTYGAKLAVIGSGNGVLAVGQATSYTTLQSNGQDFYLNMKGTGSTIFRLGSGDATAMTLNATGLGVGGSPTSKLGIFAGADGDVALFRGGSTRQVQIGTSATAGYLNTDNGSAGLEIRTQGVARAYVDNSGNVGIGVTPSYLLHTAVASGANRNMARFQVTGASNGLTITWNHATTKMIVNFSNLPTSSAGLASGDLWIDTSAGNTLKVA